METLAVYNDENVSEEELKGFRNRRAVRGVIFDADKNVALLHATTVNYYGLPGGGVDPHETTHQGIVRECKEEIGCDIEILSELGKTLEYRKGNSLINESFGYMANVIGEKGMPIFVGDENDLEKNSVIVWVPLSEAIDLVENTPARDFLYSQYIARRDLTFLKKAQESLI